MRTRRLDRSYKDKVVEVFRICFDYSSKEGALYLGDDSVWKYVWGMEDRGQLVATYMSIPTKTKIRGIVFEGHYVDGVATMPFHRK
ncbi:MAG: GCN5-related N-acetyltransferase, partial [Thermotogales bacterium 46_20]